MLNERFQFKFVRETTDEEYCQINEMITGMDKVELIYSAKTPLVESYTEIINLIDDYKENKILPEILKYYVIVKVQNFLNSVRGYVDTFSHTLSLEYGKDSEIYHKINELKSVMYDRYFSYRFIEILSHYAKQKTIPINLLCISSFNEEKEVKLIVQKEDLLTDEIIIGEKRDDIYKNCADEIDLLPHLTNMLSLLLTINEQMVFSAINNSNYNEFLQFETDFCGMFGHPVLLDTVDLNVSDKENARPRFLNFNKIKYIISDLNDTLTYMQNLN